MCAAHLGIKHPRAFLQKALTLIRKHRAVKIRPILYLVNGYHCSLRPPHPQFYVVERAGSKWVCNCPGFQRYDFCTHACSVMILESCEKAENSQRIRLEKAAKENAGFG